ncbi:hypothetical protein D3C81_1943080 [compost metagenome]
MLTPVIDLKSSPDRCVELPGPDDAKLSAPGRVLASCTRSATLVAGMPGDTTRMLAFCVA